MKIGRQNEELKRLVTLNKDKLIGGIKNLILEERKNVEKLRVENELLKRRLRDLEHKPPQNVVPLKEPASKKNG
jgi:hypothetical protein